MSALWILMAEHNIDLLGWRCPNQLNQLPWPEWRGLDRSPEPTTTGVLGVHGHALLARFAAARRP